jgi:acylphosphatase
MAQQFHAIVHGRVQGVSFRYYAKIEADRLGLTGWVRNLPDGTVEATASGPREALDSLVRWLRHGPSGARVTGVEVDWIDDPQTFEAFDIRHYDAE